jgi:hypothetical protein
MMALFPMIDNNPLALTSGLYRPQGELKMKPLKNLLATLCLLAAFSATASAGTMEMPGAIPPPPPSELRASATQPEPVTLATFTRLAFDCLTGLWIIL